MSDFNIQLKKKNHREKNVLDKIKNLFEDKKKRYLYMILFIIPFVIAIGVFGFISYKEAKNIINLVTGSSEIREEYQISSMGYILRDNPTDYQFEVFTELKNAIEKDNADDATVAGLVCKNYVVDFYTWTNKQGQYDVGGMHYLYDGEFVDGTKTKENFYQNARTTFYKYLNVYIKEYGAENLLEVDNVNVVSSSKTDNYIINEHIANKQDENGDWYDYREDIPYEAYKVTCSWIYKPNSKFDPSRFATNMNFLVIKEGEKFSIVAASENEININQQTNQFNQEEISDVE